MDEVHRPVEWIAVPRDRARRAPTLFTDDRDVRRLTPEPLADQRLAPRVELRDEIVPPLLGRRRPLPVSVEEQPRRVGRDGARDLSELFGGHAGNASTAEPVGKGSTLPRASAVPPPTFRARVTSSRA